MSNISASEQLLIFAPLAVFFLSVFIQYIITAKEENCKKSIQPNTESINNDLEQVTNSYNRGEITLEEYNRLKQDIINNL